MTIVATHNRKELTVRSISSLIASCKEAEVDLEVVVVDSASSDGTLEALRELNCLLTEVSVPSDKYWAESMRIAWQHTRLMQAEYIVWLNDDVVLERPAIGEMIRLSKNLSDTAVVIGSLSDQFGESITYGGYMRGPWFARLRLSRLVPGQDRKFADLANGNLLLVRKSLDKALGGFPPGFRHSGADLLYTWKAHRAGVPVVVAGGILGTCQANPTTNTWMDRSLPFRRRWKLLNSPKGLPLATWYRLCLAIGGVSGPAYVLWPHFRLAMESLFSKRSS